MHSSAACARQAHSTAAAGEECAMDSCVLKVGLRYNGPTHVPLKITPARGGSVSPSHICFFGSHESAFQMASGQFGRLLNSSLVCPTHTDTQTALRATLVAIGRSCVLHADDAA